MRDLDRKGNITSYGSSRIYITDNTLTKREAFATAALQGLCANGAGGSTETFAEVAVELADALLVALEKG